MFATRILLDFIITEKIVDQAKRAIRYPPINSYDDLYNTLRINLAPTSSVKLCRSRKLAEKAVIQYKSII